jgi:AraC-like DNA-binding protein
MHQRPLVRSAAIAGYAEVARRLGLDPERLVRQVGLRMRSLAMPDAQIPAFRIYRLLELSAASAGIDDFGLRLAGRRGLSHLGALGFLIRDEPNARAALQRMVRGMNLHSSCVTLELQEAHGIAMLSLAVLPDGEPVIRQSVEAALAQLFQVMRNLFEPRWCPLRVQFIHAAGCTDRSHKALFACPVDFSTDRNAIVLRSTDLDAEVPGADAGFRDYAATRAASALQVGGKAGSERVRQVIQALLAGGRCTSTTVAEHLGMDRRTLHRHLDAVGESFSKLLAAQRIELALQYLEGDRLSITDISVLLGFNSPGSMSRWFVAATGRTPTQWRREARVEV